MFSSFPFRPDEVYSSRRKLVNKVNQCSVPENTKQLQDQDGLLNTADNRTWALVNGPKLVPLLATRCLYVRGMSELRSTGPNIVLVLATRCLYWWEYIWAQVNWTSISTWLGHQMLLPGGMSDWWSAPLKGWPNVKLTWHSTALEH